MKNEIKEEIRNFVKPDKAEFQKRIVNTNYPVLGSSVTDMRKIAKKFKDSQIIWEENLAYEDILVGGFIIAYNNDSILSKTESIHEYLKFADSWALIDSFCSTLKVKPNERELLFKLLKEDLNSKNEILERYALIMFLTHFIKLDENGKKIRRPKTISIEDLNSTNNSSYLEPILNIINRPFIPYYASMGTAWLLAEAFLFYPKRIIEFLKNNNLDSITHNRVIQKIVESRTPSKEVKEFLRSLKKAK